MYVTHIPVVTSKVYTTLRNCLLFVSVHQIEDHADNCKHYSSCRQQCVAYEKSKMNGLMNMAFRNYTCNQIYISTSNLTGFNLCKMYLVV